MKTEATGNGMRAHVGDEIVVRGIAIGVIARRARSPVCTTRTAVRRTTCAGRTRDG
ncbi:hypothetical protein OG762_01115 [Streptomyces sp. NBC_01136]|uniref:hypothetical protein n=1 Tax=unclassified Streptomyces TaxID=2593676 RepID=UPI00324F96D9|nr:hypothetical protein OG762_01115 [Streptomyces sp. NBC_01136]